MGVMRRVELPPIGDPWLILFTDNTLLTFLGPNTSMITCSQSAPSKDSISLATTDKSAYVCSSGCDIAFHHVLCNSQATKRGFCGLVGEDLYTNLFK